MATHAAATRISTRCLSRHRHSLLGGIRAASTQSQNPSYPLTPSVAQLLHEHNISSATIPEIPATGPRGRLLKGDVLSYVGAISADYSSNLSSQISRLSHLDLSNIKAAPTPAPSPSKEQQQQPQPQEQPQQELPTVPEIDHIKISTPISFANLLSLQERVQKGIGVSLPLTTLVNRAVSLSNVDLPVSPETYASGPRRMDDLYDQLLNANASPSPTPARTSTGSYFPELETEADLAFEDSMQKMTTEEDIIDILSGRASTVPKQIQADPLPEDSAAAEEDTSIFSLTVPTADKARAREFLRRVQSYVEEKPDALLLI